MKSLLIDQIKAAPYTTKVIRNLVKQGVLSPQNPHHKAIMETNVYRLRRGLCLPAAAATCINIVTQKRLIGDNEGKIKIGDFYRLLLPHHGLFKSKAIPQGWLVSTDQGDVYHHAIIAFSKALGIEAISVNSFKSLSEFRELVQTGNSVAVSLDNSFVPEQTLKIYNCVKKKGDNVFIEVEISPGIKRLQKFEHGRHVVTILNFLEDSITIADSFNLPQTRTHGLTVNVSLNNADRYLSYSTGEVTRGIIFLSPRTPHSLLDKFNITPTPIPKSVTQALASQVRGLLR